jgi:myosin heavy subunit
LNKCLKLCYQREKRHRQNFESKEELQTKCQTLEYQLAQQRLEYQALQAVHQEYVQDTRGQLQDLYVLQSQSQEEKDPQETQALFERLFVRVATASTQPRMDTLQGQLRASREETRQAQQQYISQKEDMEYATHVETLEMALQRAASNIISGDGVTSEEIKEVLSKLQSMSPAEAASSFQERRAMQVTILELLERLAANNPTRETVQDLEVKLAATTQKEKQRAAQLKDLLSEYKVIEWEKQQDQKELQTTEAWYQEKLHASMEREKDLEAQLEELAVEAVQGEDLETELQTSRQQYETELEQSQLREQTSSKKVVELEAQLKQVTMEDQQQRSLSLKSATTTTTTTAADAKKNEKESTHTETNTPPPQDMEEEWRLRLQLQLKDAILSDKDHSSPPRLTPTDTDSSHSHSEDEFFLSPQVFLSPKFLFRGKRDAVVAKQLQLQQQLQALNNDRELRETQQ